MRLAAPCVPLLLDADPDSFDRRASRGADAKGTSNMSNPRAQAVKTATTISSCQKPMWPAATAAKIQQIVRWPGAKIKGRRQCSRTLMMSATRFDYPAPPRKRDGRVQCNPSDEHLRAISLQSPGLHALRMGIHVSGRTAVLHSHVVEFACTCPAPLTVLSLKGGFRPLTIVRQPDPDPVVASV